MRPVRVGRPLLLNGWVNLSTVRNRIARARGEACWPDNIPDWLDKYAPGHSFVDVGCMWKINGEIAFEGRNAQELRNNALIKRYYLGQEGRHGGEGT